MHCSCSTSSSRAVGLSSTTSTCSPAARAGTGVACAACCAPSAARPKRTSKMNSLPCPASLRSVMVPPISSTSWRLMARPRPLPPKRRAVEASACVKGWNSRACCSGVMPGPVSRTEKRSVVCVPSLALQLTITTTSPCSVNFTALPHRFTSTCVSRCASPSRRCGTSRATPISSSSPFCWALWPTITVTRSSTSSSVNGCCSSSSLRDSIFEKSRMPSISASSVSAACLALPR